MAYKSKWESLSLALKRVMDSGVAEKDAKRDLCNAIADRKIRLRLRFTWRPIIQEFLTGRDRPTTEVCYVRKVQIPSILKPGDFDWPRSRVRKPELWQNTRGPSGSFFGNWRPAEIVRYNSGDPLPHSRRGGRALAYQHRVELNSRDVTDVLCGAESYTERVNVVPSLRSGGAKTRGVIQAMDRLWPGGIPKGLSAKDRNKAIRTQLEIDESSIPQDLPRIVQRALKERRPK
jgi:hypothetical protein